MRQPASGQQVPTQAMDQRREAHIEQGDATLLPGQPRLLRRSFSPYSCGRLQVAGVGSDMALVGPAVPRAATTGESVGGKVYRNTCICRGGKFAVWSRNPMRFTLVPWRPSSTTASSATHGVMGIVQGGSVSWQLGRQRAGDAECAHAACRSKR
ncbi:DUF3363 domain-containing protein [Providencia alcalifaciens]|uniref:DUF3363 domain-containing protein n=1 Tax=Providencia alcalifaciens TaxID=126385 RepID=UPI00249E897A|nr:DUF3363 domain-containing protein [Providencia alcalifaciens]